MQTTSSNPSPPSLWRDATDGLQRKQIFEIMLMVFGGIMGMICVWLEVLCRQYRQCIAIALPQGYHSLTTLELP